MNLIIIFAYFLITSKRSINKITLTAHILFPQTIVVLIVVILSFLPVLTTFETVTPFFGIIITVIFQIFSLTYYLHVLREMGTRSLEKTAPEVILHDVPIAIKGNQDYILNVTVSDPDGLDDINHSIVIAYYRLEGEIDWNSVNLIHFYDYPFPPPYIAFYNGTIPASNILNVETNLHIMVNASDYVNGQIGRESSSGIKTIILDSLHPRVAKIDIEGGVVGADIYYKFSESADWIVNPLSYDSTTGLFIFDVPISTGEGILLYRIRAFDLSGLSSESALYTIDFINGFAPIILVQDTPFPSPLDMQGTQLVRIRANVTDDGTIESMKIHFRFSNEDDWNITEMSLDLATGYYYVDVLVPSESGNLTFKIVAADNSGLTSETDTYTINFENAKVTPSAPSMDPLLTITIVFLSLGAGGASVVYLFLRKTGRWPKRSTSVSTDLPSPPTDDG